MIIGERIRQAREIRGLTQEELAGEIKKSKALVAQIEAGFKIPTTEFIENVADATKFPLGFFNEEPHLQFPIAEILLRARRAIKRREVLETVRYAEHVFAIYSNVLKRLTKIIPVTLPDCPTNPVEAAHQVRLAFRASPEEPLTALLYPIERAGVCFIVLPPMETREAFCVWIRGEHGDLPVIAASGGKEDGDRFRLSVAHELGHLVMHKSFLRKPSKEIETEAFAFAAELLMPATAMKREIVPPVTLTSLSKLKPRWGVSIAALIRRAYELALITTRQYHYLFQQKTILGMREREPQNLDIPVEKPRLLRKIVELVYGEQIDFNQFSADVGVRAVELRRILSDYDTKESNEALVSPKVFRFPSGARIKA